MTPQDPIAALKSLIGEAHVVTAPADMAPHLVEWRDRYQGRALCVAKPGTTEEVAAVLAFADRHGHKIVPQGGNTGLVGGGIPFESGEEIVLSLSRLNRVRDVDALNNTLTVEAGVTLQRAQEVAAEADRLFPLSLASEGSAQIGGNLATNAGGTAVLRYGNARDLALGLEVVLADGRIWNGLSGLRKDNTGYDLKQIFIGAEGTLGIITAAVLKLYPRPKALATAVVALSDPEAAVALLRHLEGESGGLVTTFELIPRIGLDFVLAHAEGTRAPLAQRYDWYVLVELSAGRGERLDTLLEESLAGAVDQGLVADAAIAQTDTQRADFWALRENLSEVQKSEGGSIKHDVSVPVSALPAFIARACAAVEERMPGIRPVPFGHIGDGNVHFNLSQPTDMAKSEFLARWDEMSTLVHGIVVEMGGSISAEHGIGRMKRDEIAQLKQGPALEMMRAIKRALDPNNTLNPGKVVWPADGAKA